MKCKYVVQHNTTYKHTKPSPNNMKKTDILHIMCINPKIHLSLCIEQH